MFCPPSRYVKVKQAHFIAVVRIPPLLQQPDCIDFNVQNVSMILAWREKTRSTGRNLKQVRWRTLPTGANSSQSQYRSPPGLVVDHVTSKRRPISFQTP